MLLRFGRAAVFGLLALAGCAHAPAPPPAPSPAPAASAAPATPPPDAAPTVKASPEPEPVESLAVTILVNGVTARDDRFCWILGDEAWAPAHMYARLNLFKEIDWAALRMSPAFGRVVLVHHQVDPGTMIRVFAAEGTPLEGNRTPWRAWVLRGAPHDELLWSVDPHTIAFAPRAVMEALASGHALAELQALAAEGTSPLRVIADVTRDPPSLHGLRGMRMELEPRGSAIAFHAELDDDDPAIGPPEVLAFFHQALAGAAPGTPEAAMDRLAARLTAQGDGPRTEMRAIYSKDEVLSAVRTIRQWADASKRQAKRSATRAP